MSSGSLQWNEMAQVPQDHRGSWFPRWRISWAAQRLSQIDHLERRLSKRQAAQLAGADGWFGVPSLCCCWRVAFATHRLEAAAMSAIHEQVPMKFACHSGSMRPGAPALVPLAGAMGARPGARVWTGSCAALARPPGAVGGPFGNAFSERALQRGFVVLAGQPGPAAMGAAFGQVERPGGRAAGVDVSRSMPGRRRAHQRLAGAQRRSAVC